MHERNRFCMSRASGTWLGWLMVHRAFGEEDEPAIPIPWGDASESHKNWRFVGLPRRAESDSVPGRNGRMGFATFAGALLGREVRASGGRRGIYLKSAFGGSI